MTKYVIGPANAGGGAGLDVVPGATGVGGTGDSSAWVVYRATRMSSTLAS
jgi:hypothetical protein